MTTERFPSRDGLLLGLLYLAVGFASVHVLTLIGLPLGVAAGAAIVLAVVVTTASLRRGVS